MKLRLNLSFFIALTILVLAAAWLASGQLGNTEDNLTSLNVNIENKSNIKRKKVQVRESVSFPYSPKIQVTGETHASRKIIARTEISGKVKQLSATRGKIITAGASILKLEDEDYPEKAKEAEARVKQREIEFTAANKLTKKGFRSETKYAESLANLQQARALKKKRQQDLANTEIVAPFEAVISDYFVEIGDVLKKGDPVAEMIDLEPILVKAFVSEKYRSSIQQGMTAHGLLIDGTKRAGKIRYISPVAKKSTRTFKVELEISNEGNKIAEGTTAELMIPLTPRAAHRISASFFSLTSNGDLGIKVVDQSDTVNFLPVKILGGSDKEIIVGGLPEKLRVITVGHGFVEPGDKVQTFKEN
jgi:multidrug efflux system membrane fusion protein